MVANGRSSSSVRDGSSSAAGTAPTLLQAPARERPFRLGGGWLQHEGPAGSDTAGWPRPAQRLAAPTRRPVSSDTAGWPRLAGGLPQLGGPDQL